MTAQSSAATSSADHQVFDRLLSERYSCRGFLPGPVPDETIERILHTAQKTASWNNVQSWNVHVTRGEGTERFRTALAERAASGAAHSRDIPAPREYTGVYLARRRECGFGLYNAVGVSRGDKAAYTRQTARNFVFFDAPHVAIVTSEEALGTYSAVDCGGYVANFMTAAASSGVDSIAQGAVGEYADFIHEHLSIPPNRLVVCGIAFGYADPDNAANTFRTRRADLDDVVTWVGGSPELTGPTSQSGAGLS
ncbi:nitroreductase family protein [Rhodococcus sp. BP-241]|uniref:nitroreductase n=1 Tax=Rhodococcus sp. BP-241 TaxID=2739441 RepID=UPI001C9AEBA4|nr:nitroreductase [Rhodococcus sp. BP-241]MBY6708582.1 nitroreductase family protein [Rhodococcus sp. BP-241]